MTLRDNYVAGKLDNSLISETWHKYRKPILLPLSPAASSPGVKIHHNQVKIANKITTVKPISITIHHLIKDDKQNTLNNNTA